MEATDGFLIVINAADGHIMYASESITSLLGHIPSDLRHISMYELLTEEDQRALYKMLTSKITTSEVDNDLQQPSDIMLHVKRGGAERRAADETNTELVRLSGFFRRWLVESSDPYADDKSGLSSIMGMGGRQEIVFMATAKLQTAQLIREMPMMNSSTNEFSSRYSLEWKFLFLDHRAPPVIGYLPFELLGTSGYDYYHQDDLKVISECHENLMHTGEAKSCCHRFLTKGQQWIWLQTRYFITYHQWNSKPEFVVATHKVINYRDVLNQLKKEKGQIESQGDAESLADSRPISYPSPAMSPTWSSRSSMCSSTAMTRVSQDQLSSCRLSSYSRSEGVPCESNHEYQQQDDEIKSDKSSSVAFQTPIIQLNPQKQPQQFQIPTVSNSVASAAPVTQPDPAITSAAALLPPPQAGQADSRPHIFLTPAQLSLQQQLRIKHAELSKKILEQQEELRRTSEQLLMSQYGLLPIPASSSNETSPLATTPVQNSGAGAGGAGTNNNSACIAISGLDGGQSIQIPYDSFAFLQDNKDLQ